MSAAEEIIQVKMAMKKMSKWALLGAVLGALFLIMSVIRYYVLYPDMDKCLVYVITGFLVIAVSFLYNRELQMTHDIEHIEDYLDEKQDQERQRQERLQERLQARREQMISKIPAPIVSTAMGQNGTQ